MATPRKPNVQTLFNVREQLTYWYRIYKTEKTHGARSTEYEMEPQRCHGSWPCVFPWGLTSSGVRRGQLC